jgi:hypothetical protein
VAVEVRFDERPFPVLLGEARALLYTYSSVPYEALLAGVPPVFVRSQVLLDLDQLDPSPEVRWAGRTAGELRVAVAEAEGAVAGDVWRRAARKAAGAALRTPAAGCIEAFTGS